MKYIMIIFFFFFFSSKVAGANVRVGGQMRRAPACFDTPGNKSPVVYWSVYEINRSPVVYWSVYEINLRLFTGNSANI